MDNIIIISGASGVVGRHLIKKAMYNGYKIRTLSRGATARVDNIETYLWDPDNENPHNLSNTIRALENSKILVNLAGVSLSEGRLNQKLQDRIMESRVKSTQLLIDAYKQCKNPPLIWAQASAAGYYGETGDKEISEKNIPGDLFLSKVCTKWEKLLLDLGSECPDLKIIISRFGLVLAKDAPAWRKMLKPISMGLGGAIGSGKQWYSWIDADEIAEAFFYLFKTNVKEKIFNFTSPDPQRQLEFTRKIARFLKKPAFLKVPAFVIKILFGKGIDELLLTSCKAIPENLLASGYIFINDTIDKEINKLLNPDNTK
jgi:hypothetical protein